MIVAAVQETHFICEGDCRVLEDDFVIFSALGSHCGVGVSILVGCILNAIVNLVFAGDGGRLVVAEVTVKIFDSEWSRWRMTLLFPTVGPFLDDLKRQVLVGDWNTILDHKIDKGGRGASGSVRCDSSLIDLLAELDLVDRVSWITQGGRCERG